MSSTEGKKSLFADLLERKLPQYFITYVGICWGLIQFTDWMVKRYDIAGHWIDRLVLFLFLILPSVLSLIYFHGRTGPDKWRPFEKIVYPLNVVLGLAVSLFMVNATGGTAVEEVTIESTEGETIVRNVPTASNTKRVSIFPFENENSSKPSWRGFGVANLLDIELEQDMRITGISPHAMAEDYKEQNYQPLAALPFAVKRKIAETDYSDYIVSGSFLDKEEHKLEVIVYDTDTGKEIGQSVLEDDNPMQLTEKVADFVESQIKFIPVEGMEEYVDLPASNLISRDTAAFRLYNQGIMAFVQGTDMLPMAIQYFQQSVQKDPTCAQCNAFLGDIIRVNAMDSKPYFVEAMKYLDNLSERQQLNIKFLNYAVANEQDKAVKLLENWRKLYPQDTKPVKTQARFLRSTLRDAEAEEVYKDAISKGHGGSMYLSLANTQIKLRKWKDAEESVKKYKELYPKQSKSSSVLADIYLGQGDYTKAIEMLDELALMNPTKVGYDIKKARVLYKDNRFEESANLLTSSYEKANTNKDTMSVIDCEMELLSRQGRIAEYYDKRRLYKKHFVKDYPPINFLQKEYFTSPNYAFVDQVDSIEKNFKEMESFLPPAQKGFVQVLNKFMLDIFRKDVTAVEESYPKVKPFFTQGAGQSAIQIYDASIAKLKGENDKVIELLTKLIEDKGDYNLVSDDYYQAFIDADRVDEGLVAVNKAIATDKNNPMYLVFKAKMLAAKGDKAQAGELLTKVQACYKNADAAYKFKKMADELAGSL